MTTMKRGATKGEGKPSPAAYGSLREAVEQLAFAIETVAHLRGLERELLPYAEAARETLKREAKPVSSEQDCEHCSECERGAEPHYRNGVLHTKGGA